MTEIETDLRAWMQDRAARVHASPKILDADYHPRSRARRPRLALGGGLAAAAATLAAVLSLAGGASTAFAGWTPQPTTPSSTQLTGAEAYCTANMPDHGLQLQLVDSRGPYLSLVYAAGATNDFCTVGPSLRNASGWTTSTPVTPAAGQIYLWTDHTSTDQGQPYGTMIARAGDGVTAAKLTLTDGSVVTATVRNGWVAAWWPGNGHPASAQLTTPSGTQTQTFATYPCDVHSCSGGSGSHGGSRGGGPGGG